MISSMKIGMLGLGLSAMLALAGCQSSGGSLASAGAPKVVTCTKCLVTWVHDPSGASNQGTGIRKYTNSKSIECPDCENSATNLILQNGVGHNCRHCDGTMEVCTVHKD